MRFAAISGIVLVAALSMPHVAGAELPFRADLAGDRDLPRPWGLSVDFFGMDQDYAIESLQFIFPGIQIGDVSDVAVTSEVRNFDLKGDVWILPFLNLHALIGRVDGTTEVDLSRLEIVGLPIVLPQLDLEYNGLVWGGGFTLAFGGERWFASATTTWTTADLSGDFSTTVDTLAVQPRVGPVWKQWQLWVGGMYLDIDETHTGTFDFGLPFLPPVPFEVTLAAAEAWNYSVGARWVVHEHFDLTGEIGFGDRDHVLLNLAYRF